jgi:hypothetical protein
MDSNIRIRSAGRWRAFRALSMWGVPVYALPVIDPQQASSTS